MCKRQTEMKEVCSCSIIIDKLQVKMNESKKKKKNMRNIIVSLLFTGCQQISRYDFQESF